MNAKERALRHLKKGAKMYRKGDAHEQYKALKDKKKLPHFDYHRSQSAKTKAFKRLTMEDYEKLYSSE